MGGESSLQPSDQECRVPEHSPASAWKRGSLRGQRLGRRPSAAASRSPHASSLLLFRICPLPYPQTGVTALSPTRGHQARRQAHLPRPDASPTRADKARTRLVAVFPCSREAELTPGRQLRKEDGTPSRPAQTRLNFPAAVAAPSYWPARVTWRRPS